MDRGAALHKALRRIAHVQVLNTNLDLGVQIQRVLVHRHDGFSYGTKRTALTLDALFQGGQVVQTNDHVLGRNSHRAAIGGLQDVVRGEHQDASLGLSLDRERKVNSHLVTVEVSVERSTDEGVQLNCFTFHQLRLKRLDAQTVKGGCAVQQNRALTNDLFKNIPHLGA